MSFRRPQWFTDLLHVAKQATRTVLPSPRSDSLRGLWRFRHVQPADLDTLRALIHLGDQLALLQSLPEWTALLEVKANLQAISEETCRLRPGAQGDREDRLRSLAAAEWWALEVFFSTIHRTIAQANQARTRLKTMVVPLP